MGRKGGLSFDVEERSYVSGGPAGTGRGESRTSLTLRRHWEKPQVLDVDGANGAGHGGGDDRMLADIFGPERGDPLGRAARPVDGAWAMLTGVAANRSFATGQAVVPSDLLSVAGREALTRLPTGE